MEKIKKESLKNELTVKYILRWFSPRWFIFIMGTGALANIFQLLAGKPTGALHNLAGFFLMVTLVVFPVVLFFMLFRFFVGLDCILKEWRHSSLIQFYSTISIAAAICTTGLLNIPMSFISESTAYILAVVFWWIACLVGIFFISETFFWMGKCSFFSRRNKKCKKSNSKSSYNNNISCWRIKCSCCNFFSWNNSN